MSKDGKTVISKKKKKAGSIRPTFQGSNDVKIQRSLIIRLSHRVVRDPYVDHRIQTLYAKVRSNVRSPLSSA